jgi:hypothetical protein
LPGTDQQIHLRHPEVRHGHHHEARRDEPAGVQASAEEEPDERQDHDCGNAGRRLNQARGQRVVAEKRLQQLGERRARAVQNGVGAEDEQAGQREIPLQHGAEIDDGIRLIRLPNDQPDQAEHEEQGQGLHAPEGVAQPVPLLPLAEHHFPGSHGDDQHAQADRVETERLLSGRGPFRLEILGVFHKRVTSHQRQQSHRYVDVEYPPPLVLDREPAAERGTDDRGQQGRHAEERHRGALLLGGKRVQQDALARRLKAAAGEALQGAEKDDLPQAGRHAAEARGDGKDGDGKEEIVAAAEVCGKPTRDRNDDRVGGQVAGDDPFAVDHRGRQAAGDVAQGDVRHGRVEHFHERGNDHGHGDQPGIDRLSRQGQRQGDRAHRLGSAEPGGGRPAMSTGI